MYSAFKCKDCTLCAGKHLLPKEPEQKDVMIILNRPSKSQADAETLLDNKAWQKIKIWLANAGIPPAKVYLTCLIRGYYDKTRHKEVQYEQAKEACWQYVFREIEIVKPKVIIAMGKDSFEMIFKNDESFSKSVGNEIKSPLGISVIPAYTPAFFERSEENNRYLNSQDMAFRKLKACIEGESTVSAIDYGIIDTWEKLLQLKKDLDEVDNFVFDMEGTSLDFFKNEMTGVGFSWKRYKARYVPLKIFMPILGLGPFWKEKQDDAIQIIREILENPAAKAGHNVKFDAKNFYHEFGIVVNNIAMDSMLLRSVVAPGQKRYGLDALSYEYSDLAGYKDSVKDKEIYRLPLKEVALYNSKDCDLTFRLIEDDAPKLDEGTSRLFTDLMMPLSDLTMKLEYFGVKVDTEYAIELHKQLFEETTTLQNKICSVLGKKINLRSSDQLGYILYDVLRLPVLDKTKGGAPSTSKEVLNKLLRTTNNSTLAEIMKFRSLASIKSVHVDSFVPSNKRKDNFEKDYLLDKDGYYHGNYKLAWTSTGRLSAGREEGMEEANSINLQGVPRDPRIRKLYVADPGHLFIGADYAQIELRVLAHLCQDIALLRAFEENYDPHCYVSSTMMGVPYEEVLEGYKAGNPKYKKVRDTSKNVGFGWVYGAGDGKFADFFPGRTEQERKIAEKEAKTRYFERFNRIIPWKNASLETARAQGFVRTISGRKIAVEEINSTNAGVKSHAERQAINGLIQGPASDLTAMAAIEIDGYFRANNLDGRVIHMVHDFCAESVAPELASEFYQVKKEIMESSKFGIITKMKADIDISDRWTGKNMTKQYLGG